MRDQPYEPAEPVRPAQSVPPPPPTRRLSPAWTIRLVVSALILIALIIIGFQNNQEVRLDLFFWTFHLRLFWALLIAAVLGYILGWLRPRFRPRRAT